MRRPLPRDRHVPTATAQIGPATDEQLKEKACALRKALDCEACDCEACDCEYIERGSTRVGAMIVTLGEFKLEVPPSATLGEFKLERAAAERDV